MVLSLVVRFFEFKNGLSLTQRKALTRWLPAITISVAALLATPWLVGPRCPDHVVIATGNTNGAYFAYAQRYRDIFEKSGIELEVRSSTGSIENQTLLETDAVSLAMLQGGTAVPDLETGVESLASLYLEPVWIFCRSDEPIDDFRQLRGKRIAVGPDGSGTQAIALKLLGDNEMGPVIDSTEDTKFVKWNISDSVDGLKSGAIDVAFLVISSESPIVHDLLTTEGIELMNCRRADAYQRMYPFLSSVTLPEGLIDLQNNIPDRDIVLLAPTANLVCRKDLHPALVPLLLQAMQEVHGERSMLAQSESFPSANFVDLPLNQDARQFFESGPSFFYRYLPFWLAAWLDRVKLILLPMCTLMLPLLKVAPPVYRWRIRSKIYRWYRVLREIDQKLKEAPADADLSQDVKTLNKLELELAEVSVPLSYMEEFYSLRIHIEFVRNNLHSHHSQQSCETSSIRTAKNAA